MGSCENASIAKQRSRRNVSMLRKELKLTLNDSITSYSCCHAFHILPSFESECELSLNFLLFSVEKSGDVCISILHDPGEDKYGYERPEERWLPVHTVETIMVSVISMLADPNDESPANLDASVSRVLFVKKIVSGS